MASPPSDVRKLGSRFPCCLVACRHDLEPLEAREVTCPRCGRRFTALLVPCGAHAERMAGRPVGKVRFEPVGVGA